MSAVTQAIQALIDKENSLPVTSARHQKLTGLYAALNAVKEAGADREYQSCSCLAVCGDVAEEDDAPLVVCRGLWRRSDAH